jgi:sulfur carrier protein ThiS
MAKNIIAEALGGQPKLIEAATVQDAFNALNLPKGNYTASINGDEASMSDELSDRDHVTFAQAVKGGM